jgi:hypothetical protein
LFSIRFGSEICTKLFENSYALYISSLRSEKLRHTERAAPPRGEAVPHPRRDPAPLTQTARCTIAAMDPQKRERPMQAHVFDNKTQWPPKQRGWLVKVVAAAAGKTRRFRMAKLVA